MHPALKRTAEQARQVLIALVVVTTFVFVIENYGPKLKARIGGGFAPELSLVDRAMIGGCKSILASGDTAEAKGRNSRLCVASGTRTASSRRSTAMYRS